MTSFGSPAGNVLYLGVSAVPGADQIIARIRAEQADGWNVCAIATERALHWFDADQVIALTGHQLQTRMSVYGEPLFQPLGDKMIIAPAGFNTINKIALGLADDMVSGLACEAISSGISLTIEPQMSTGFSNHPIFGESIARLRDAGVNLVWNDTTIEPPGTSE